MKQDFGLMKASVLNKETAETPDDDNKADNILEHVNINTYAKDQRSLKIFAVCRNDSKFLEIVMRLKTLFLKNASNLTVTKQKHITD